ncbi:G1/S-specific cyclin-E-like [Homarus americanus]|uniref:G1/S-specific cyclin-E-like n=1 Tax=Homarus americanus TaxID=6706 RepID=UPI001C46A853|nr:G1/S-specific cyclin-E-like [Homarus americanus]XP_042243298.1 G1/S-specific cyclin-E-like [Homarus americanus]
MSQNQRRLKNGSLSTRTKPAILRTRKRKSSENEEDERQVKQARVEHSEMLHQPLGDVTSSLNVERERSVTPDNPVPDAWNKFRGLTCIPTPQSTRKLPLPKLSWADQGQVWALMCRKDRLYPRRPDYLTQHPSLQPRMRAILLDWLTEVCEVYRLHRETYYLATDFIDRYLTASQDVPKQQLQLIGITCLFIAAKIEEIYPPKLSEFAYVTDGACMDNEILEKELVILKKLNWDLSPITSNCWLNTYLQLAQDVGSNETATDEHSFVFPRYSPLTFVQVARILDLCTLDMSSLAFSSSMIAATALCYVISPAVACQVSGYSREQLQECQDWMVAFYLTANEMGPMQLKSFSQVAQDDMHNIQTHSVDLDTLERAQIRLNEVRSSSSRKSPETSGVSAAMLTPPKTDEKTRFVVEFTG